MGTALLKTLEGFAREPDSLPRSFGRYVLFDRIGRGGMADIYLATVHTELEATRLAVVKQILPSLSEDAGFSRMLIEEAKLAARLSHANVVQVFDLGREAGRLYIGMEYVEGYDLNQLLRRLSDSKTPLPAEFAIFIVCEVLRALDYAHRARTEDGKSMGLVHRDVSPSNVLVSFEGEVKLCDFGIARAYALVGGEDEDGWPASSPGSSTFVGRAPVSLVAARETPPTPVRHPAQGIAGKAAYMAPEHALGATIDARADVFSAGVILWQLCAGRKLYRGTDEEVLAQACIGKIPPLPERGMPDHAALQALLDRALSAFVDTRYQSASEMLTDLETYAARNGLLASQLRFGAFLTDHFSSEIVSVRREREQASEQLIGWRDLPDRSRPVPEQSGAIPKLARRDDEADLDDDDELVSLFSQEDPERPRSELEREIAGILHRSTIRPVSPRSATGVVEGDLGFEPEPFPESAMAHEPPDPSSDANALGTGDTPSADSDPPPPAQPVGRASDPVFPSARSIRESSPPEPMVESGELPVPAAVSAEVENDPDRIFPSARDIRESLPPPAPAPPTSSRAGRRAARFEDEDEPIAVTRPTGAPLLVPIAVMLGFALVIAALVAMSIVH